jgi:hypothetical protein
VNVVPLPLHCQSCGATWNDVSDCGERLVTLRRSFLPLSLQAKLGRKTGIMCTGCIEGFIALGPDYFLTGDEDEW